MEPSPSPVFREKLRFCAANEVQCQEKVKASTCPGLSSSSENLQKPPATGTEPQLTRFSLLTRRLPGCREVRNVP